MYLRSILLSVSAIGFAAVAIAQQPSPEEAMARCVAEVSEQAKAMGHDESRATEICECLVPKIGADADLIAEVEANEGLPGPGEASEALDKVIKSCVPNP